MATTDQTLTPDKNGPERFDELEVLPVGARAYRYCSEAATHRMQNVVRLVHPGKGRTGLPPKIANHTQDYCEKHAVQLFAKIRTAMR